MSTVLAYLRVSTDEQADSGAGLAAQRAAILAEAQRRGWTEVRFIEDLGYSGKSLKRPGILAALEALKRKKADTLVVAKLDRLSRSLLDFSGLMTRATKEHWALVALDLGVDTTTPQGEMMANVLATFAQFERRLIGQRTKEALAARRAQNPDLVVGRAANIPDEVVARIRAEYRAGATLAQVADGLTADGVATAQGGRRWYPSTISGVLKRAGEPARRRGREIARVKDTVLGG